MTVPAPTARPTRRRATLALLVVAALAPMATADAQVGPAPYRDPPFACLLHDYGTAPPTLPAPADDPLCVRYDKTNITATTLEIADFVLAEPGRVALVAGKCGYWQRDHWSVRLAPGTPALLEWEGSYWYDLRTGTAGAALRGLAVAGQPVDGTTFVEAARPLVGDATAAQLLAYADRRGGGGMSFALPAGTGDAVCGATSVAPTPGAGVPSTERPVGSDVAATTAPAGGRQARLPATGGGSLSLLAPVALLAGLLLRAARRRTETIRSAR